MSVLLFDFDGVIADTFPIEIKYFLPICKEKNIYQLSSAEDLMRICEDNVFTSMQNLGISIPLYLEAYTQYYETLRKERYIAKPYPGMIELLKELVQRHSVYIVTSNIYDFPNDMLLHYDVTGIKGILSAEMDASKVKKINSFQGKYPGDKIYFITDTKGDVLEALDSIADVIVAVTWGYHGRELLETTNTDVIVDNVSELKEYFKNVI